MLKNLLYRYYNCNIQCPKVLSDEIKTSKLEFDSWTASGIVLQSGEIDFGTTFDISPTSLSLRNAVGELTVYLKNDGEEMVHIIMMIITKTAGTMNPPLNYQTVGNLNTVVISTPSSTTVRIVVTPGAVCKWIWRAI